MMRIRLGISELYSSLILLIIISTIGSVVYSYTLETATVYEQHFSEQNKKEVKRIKEKIEVISVKSENSNVNIIVYNYGEFDTSIVQIYINNSMVNTYYEGIGENISPYNMKEITFYSPISISEGNRYEIIIVSNNGVIELYEWKK